MSNYNVQYIEGNNNNCWNIALNMVQPNSEVLDVGCSKGGFGVALMERKNCQVDGIEPDADDCALAKKVLRNTFQGVVEDAFNEAFSSNKYDYIVFMDVIEHLYNPVAVLKLVTTHLKPNGKILFSIPNMAHISVRLMLMQGNFDYGKTGLLDNTHLHFYTLREIERVFGEAGLGISEMRPNESTYPKELIQKQLHQLGLIATNDGIKMLSEDSARIFQYVGTAIVAKQQKKVERLSYSPDPQGEISREYENRLAHARDQLQEYSTRIEILEATISELQQYNDHSSIKNISLLKRIARRIRSK